MKKLRLTLVMIAVVLGIAGAAITKAASHKSTAGDTMYYWLDPTGAYTGDNASLSQEKTNTGCTATNAIVCENGYTGDQFVTENDPDSGVKSGETPVTIHPVQP